MKACLHAWVHADGGIHTVKMSWFWLWALSVSEMSPAPSAEGNARRWVADNIQTGYLLWNLNSKE